MKSIFTQLFFLLVFSISVFNQSIFAQCSLINNSRDALFITYERTAQVKVEGKEKLQEGVILRLHNNSTCGVIITTGSADKFYKPLPENPTPQQRFKREIDDLPDGALVPDVQYRYQTSKGSGRNLGGDSFFGLKLSGNRSILFEVPFKHFDVSFASKIVLPFDYVWQEENRAQFFYKSVETLVNFWTESLPEEVRRKMKKQRK